MQSHVELSNQFFEERFKHCQLNAALFKYEAHLRLAWIHVTKYGVEKAIKNISMQLYAFVISLSAANKYNPTLAVAAVKAVHHFFSKSAANNFHDFIREFPRLTTHFRELVACHYLTDIFNSDIAKQHYAAPDLLPFS